MVGIGCRDGSSGIRVLVRLGSVSKRAMYIEPEMETNKKKQRKIETRTETDIVIETGRQ